MPASSASQRSASSRSAAATSSTALSTSTPASASIATWTITNQFSSAPPRKFCTMRMLSSVTGPVLSIRAQLSSTYAE
jgi:hypothetical protein